MALISAQAPSRTFIRARSTTTKAQPWKSFWPLDSARFTSAQRARMPWLGSQQNSSAASAGKGKEKLCAQWAHLDQEGIVRRGSSGKTIP